MTWIAARFAHEAEGLVGVPFRLHGRDARIGLDCVGLVATALQRAGIECAVPHGYTLRHLDIAAMLGCAEDAGFHETGEPMARGDLLLVRPGPAQHHLCIAVAKNRFVHAHAGIGRVVEHGGLADWPVLRRWRLHSF